MTLFRNTLQLIISLLVIGSLQTMSQSLQHPIIYITNEERPALLEKIENYSWAQNLVSQLHNHVDGKMATHQSNPIAILNTIPDFPANDANSESFASPLASGHNRVLTLASYSGMLYYITEEEKYAQFAADILAYYMEKISSRSVSNTTISGNYFYDPRTTYPHFAIAYDFIYNFLNQTGSTVYSKETGTYVTYDSLKAQKAIRNIAGNALNESGGYDTHGRTISNHPVLTAPGALFPILCIDDDVERARLLNVFFEQGTRRQNSFLHTILPMFGEQGIWPESTSYSFMPNVSFIINAYDRINPDMNLAEAGQHIFEGIFLFENLRNPDRRFVRYGDSKRNSDYTDKNYKYVLNLSKRKGYSDLQSKAETSLKQFYNAEGGRDPEIVISTFDNYSATELFWGESVPSSSVEKFDYKPTVLVKHAGVALQRNYVQEQNSTYGLCGIIGGAHYVHSHCTGIAMELYGSGYVMGPNGGLPPSVAERREPEHEKYFRLYAGNNTVIVNGTSHGLQAGSWKDNAYLWQNTTVNIAAEPGHLEQPISNNFSFATQFLDDNVNSIDQQRTLSTIRTSATTGYYFDMFRSKSLVENNFHDYIYHNLGDRTQILDVDEESFQVSPTDRYQTDIGDPVQSPGWRFFENTEVSDPTDAFVKVRFDINYNNRYMHMFVPGGIEREYTKALGPATREAKNGYVNKKTQIMAIRQQGEAWDQPFTAIFEPAGSSASSIVMVEHLYQGDTIIGVKVESEIDKKTIEDYILCLPGSNKRIVLPEHGILFTGRFAVVRYEQDMDTAFTTLYIGEGDSLAYKNVSLFAEDGRKGIKFFGSEPYFGRQLFFRNLNNKDVIPKGSDLSIEAVVGEEFIEVTLWANDTINLGTKTAAPYVWSGHEILTNMQDDAYTFTLVAKDAQGYEEEERIIIETPSQKPYPDSDLPHQVPGTIQFENYDSGGEGLGYHDSSGQDTISYTYRDNDNVDLGRNGTIVSSLEAEEWLEYTLDVQLTGFYILKIRHRTTLSPGVQAFHLILPDATDTLLLNVETLYTGRSDFYTDEVGVIFLHSGKQVLRFAILGSGFDLDYMEFTHIPNAYRLTTQADHGQILQDPDNAFYTSGTDVTLTALPDSGYLFISWSGDYAQTENPLTVKIGDSDLYIRANFEAEPSTGFGSNQSTVKVYPNPNNGNFHIKLEPGVSAFYKLYHVGGSQFATGNFIFETQLHLDTVEKGIYLLEIDTKDDIYIKRIVIQ